VVSVALIALFTRVMILLSGANANSLAETALVYAGNKVSMSINDCLALARIASIATILIESFYGL